MQEWVIAAYEPPLIDAKRLTLPQFLRDHGYETACIGKWHLGWDWKGPQTPVMHPVLRNFQRDLTWDFTQSIGGGPTSRGFDYYFGVVLPNMPPFCWIENDRVVVQPTAQYLHGEEGKLAFMPAAFNGAPMAPDWKFEKILPELTRRGVEYIHQHANDEKPFFLYFPQTSPHEPVVPSEKFQGKSGIAPIADFVMETDWSAGQIIGAIDKAGIAENTLVIFTADNGHSHYTGWQKLIEAGHLPSGPFRGHKGDVWEGGHRVPLIARWPNHIKANSSSTQMVCLTDLFATCADLIGAELPNDSAQDSYSFLPSAVGKKFSGSENAKRSTMINHSNFGEFAYRNENWKLVYRLGGKNLTQSRGKATVAELYNLENDIAEERDLAGVEIDRVQAMSTELAQAIQLGASRPHASGQNDCRVDFKVTQSFRWVED